MFIAQVYPYISYTTGTSSVQVKRRSRLRKATTGIASQADTQGRYPRLSELSRFKNQHCLLAGNYSRYINISLGVSSPVIGCLTRRLSGRRVRFFL